MSEAREIFPYREIGQKDTVDFSARPVKVVPKGSAPVTADTSEAKPSPETPVTVVEENPNQIPLFLHPSQVPPPPSVPTQVTKSGSSEQTADPKQETSPTPTSSSPSKDEQTS